MNALMLLTVAVLALACLVVPPNEEHELVFGSPGSGKSVGAARDIVRSPNSAVVLDPHSASLARLVLEHTPGPNILFDNLSDPNHALKYGFLKPSTHPDPEKRTFQTQRRAQVFVEILMRRRAGGDIAATPQTEEYVLGLLQLFLFQATPKPASILPYGFVPDSSEFQALVRDCTLPEVVAKFKYLAGLTPRGLRSEVAGAQRLVNGSFRSPAFARRCDGGLDLAAFLQMPGARLIIEGGDEIDEDAKRLIIGGIGVLVADYCETRPSPWPIVEVCYDEAASARTVGRYEESKAGQTRKRGLKYRFLSQWDNFVGGAEGFYQNCVRKVVYRVAEYELAHRLAKIAAAGVQGTGESRTELINRLTNDIMNFQPGTRLVTDRQGTRIEKVPLLRNPWPDWPGLREAKLEQLLCQIYAHPAYGVRATQKSTPSSGPSASPPLSSLDSSAAERWWNERRKRLGGSPESGGGDGSA